MYHILNFCKRTGIAEEAGITEEAIKQHLTKLYEKTGVPIHDFRALAIWVYENKLDEFIIRYVEGL